MVDTRFLRPVRLIRNLDFILGEHTFTVSPVGLRLDAPVAYPLLLGRSWLRTTNIRQHWQRNMISFRRGKTKVQVVTEERIKMPPNNIPLYVEAVHMLNGFTDDEMESYWKSTPQSSPSSKSTSSQP